MVERIRAKVAGRVLAALFVIAVPLFLITNSVTWAVNDLRLYEHGFDKYDISRATGIDDDGLMSAARQIRGYFNSTDEPIEIRAEIFGEERELFNQREVLHMRDVKHLIWGVYGVGAAAAVYLLGFVGIGFFIHRRSFVPALSRHVLWGSCLTLAVVVLVGLAALVGFDSLFLAFHRLSFSNDFWMLDPTRDYLVRMFPQGFWFDATLFVALSTITQAVALGGIAGGGLAFRRWRERKTQQEPLLRHPSKAAEL